MNRARGPSRVQRHSAFSHCHTMFAHSKFTFKNHGINLQTNKKFLQCCSKSKTHSQMSSAIGGPQAAVCLAWLTCIPKVWETWLTLWSKKELMIIDNVCSSSTDDLGIPLSKKIYLTITLVRFFSPIIVYNAYLTIMHLPIDLPVCPVGL